MAQLNFGGVTETVVIRDEFPLEKAREVLKDETIAVIGYGAFRWKWSMLRNFVTGTR